MGPALANHVSTVVVLRALTGVGDHLCSIPALRALRAGLPHAHIAVLTVPAAESLLERYPQYVDEAIPFAGFPGIPEQPFAPADLPPFYAGMIARDFDLAIQMQGNGLVSNSLAKMLGARVTAGYFLPGQYCPEPDWSMPYPAHLNEIHRHLALMDFLGFPSQGDQLELPVTDGDRAALEEVLAEVEGGRAGEQFGGGLYAIVHPGAMAEPRRWSPGGFALVADHLAKKGLTVVFTGRDPESDLIGRIRALMNSPALDLSGRTNLGTLAALVERTALVVCNDTGVSHIAAALAVPSVVIFAGTVATGSDPRRWAPLDGQRHRVVAREERGGVAPLLGGPRRPAEAAAVDDPGAPEPHARGSCCLRDACTSPLTTAEQQRLTRVSLGRVLEAVDAQLAGLPGEAVPDSSDIADSSDAARSSSVH